MSHCADSTAKFKKQANTWVDDGGTGGTFQLQAYMSSSVQSLTRASWPK